MLARQALKQKKGNIIYEIRIPKSVIQDAERRGGKVLISRAGHAYVLDEIFKKKAVFGGEITGHIYFPYCYYPYDDGIFTSLKLAELASGLTKFSNFVDTLPRGWASPEVFIDSTDEEKFKIVENLQKYLKKHNFSFLDLDGARINFNKGWALIRASNTT